MVWLDIEELDLRGYARVLEIDDAPSIEDGPGCVVLSRYTRQNNNLIEVHFGSGETLRLTETHRLYSASRDRWVQAGALQVGALHVDEDMRGAYATIPVDGFEVLEGEEQVFNLEVESEHRYLVGDSAVLAHNATARGGKDCPSGIGGGSKQPGEALDSIGDGVDDALETVAAPHGQKSTNPNGLGHKISQPKSGTKAKERRASQSKSPKDGTPGNNQAQNNQAQNKQFSDATRGLSKSQKRQVHDAMTGQNLNFHEIKAIADIIRRGGRP